MAKTASTMLPLGSAAPDFSLPDVDSKVHRLHDFGAAPGLVVAFICNHCPYVKHVRHALAQFTRDYQGKGIAVVAINSNDHGAYPQDGPDGMRAEIAEAGYAFPYLLDETQRVAQAYQAACTPDFFLFDAAHKLVYRGQFDASRPGNNQPVTGADLRAACDALLANRPIATEQHASLGCNIKWKPGNEPVYMRP